MSVRFQYSGDKDISAGRSSGASIFALPGAGFPPYGTLIQTFSNYEYPIAQGGSNLAPPWESIPAQKCTVDQLADGSGGVFLDWSNERDIAFKDYNTIFSVSSEFIDYTLGATVTIEGTHYYSQRAKEDYRHDGSGGYFSGYSNVGYKPASTYIVGVTYTTEVPSGSGNHYNNGLQRDFYHDGIGGATFTTVNDFYSGGTFIYNDGSNDWYWDGYGGYRNYQY